MTTDCYEKTNCRICNKEDLIPILDLGFQPLANSFRPAANAPADKTYPLKLMLCTHCFHLQLSHVVDPKILYENYQYVSGTSDTIRKYFESFANKVDKNNIGDSRRVLDIACNDGSQLDAFSKINWFTNGVDPATNVVATADLKTHRIYNTFFSEAFAKDVLKDTKYEAIIAQNVFAHIDNVHDFLRGCKYLLAPRGKIYIQTSQSRMIQNNEFDTIYHEHCSYFCIHSMKTLVEACGLTLYNVEQPSIHGNSFLFTIIAEAPEQATRDWIQCLIDIEYREGLHNVDTYHAYAVKVQTVCRELTACVLDYKNKGHTVISYGAPAKGMVVLNYTKLPLEYVIDDSYIKIGKFTPGTNIPIIDLDSLPVNPSPELDIVVVPLAWNFADEIKRRVLTKIPYAIFIEYFPKLSVRTHMARPARSCVIMHFYNEEYMLQQWLHHHKPMFDHGILIDYHSTDKSVDIIKKIVPNWTLITSENKVFGITMCDEEVMKVERTLARGMWKIALNVTEFLIIKDSPRSLMTYINSNIEYMYEAVTINQVIMIESKAHESQTQVDPARALIQQRTYGDPDSRERNIRVLHCKDTGNYDFGRHNIRIKPYVKAPLSDIAILWYGFSPWNVPIIERKMQIQTRMIPEEIDQGLGCEHRVSKDDLMKTWLSMQSRTQNLVNVPELSYITKYM